MRLQVDRRSQNIRRNLSRNGQSNTKALDRRSQGDIEGEI